MANQHILSQGAMPHTRAALSSRSRVFGLAKQDSPELIGAISSFGMSSSRTLEPLRGIGLGDHIIEIVPGQSEPISLSVTHFALSMEGIMQAFGYKSGVDGLVRALKHHRFPIDIKHELLMSTLANPAIPSSVGVKQATRTAGFAVGYEDDLTQFKVLITWFEGCWFQDYSITYPVDTAAITEESTLLVTDVTADPNGAPILPLADSNFHISKIWNKR